jgi:hypothetical protein
MTTTYKVEGIRVLIPKPNRKNQDVALTVKGIFKDSTGTVLSFKSKDILKAQVDSTEFRLDLAKGILTLPAGKRGKPQSKGASQSELDSYLASLKTKASA